MQRARQLNCVASAIKEFLPEAIASHCQPGNISNDTLFVYASSPAWATRLRYFAPELVKYLKSRPRIKGIRHICVIVQPKLAESTPPNVKPRRRLSQKSAALLRHAAAAADSPRLSAALQRLARHTDPKQ